MVIGDDRLEGLNVKNSCCSIYLIEIQEMTDFVFNTAARCRSAVEHLLTVGSIPHGGPTEPFIVPANAPQLVKQRPWYVLSCL